MLWPRHSMNAKVWQFRRYAYCIITPWAFPPNTSFVELIHSIALDSRFRVSTYLWTTKYMGLTVWFLYCLQEPQTRWSESPQFLTQSFSSLQKCSTLSLSSAPSSPHLRISPWIVSELTLMRSWWWTSCCSSTICSKMTERSLLSSCWNQCHLSALRLWHWQSTTRLWTALHSTPDLWTLSTSTALCLTLWMQPCHVTVRTGWQSRAHFSRKKSRTSLRTRAPNALSDTRAQKGGSTSCSQRDLWMCSSATTPTAKPSNSSGNIARASGCKRPAAASHLHGKTVLWSLSLPGNACK